MFTRNCHSRFTHILLTRHRAKNITQLPSLNKSPRSRPLTLHYLSVLIFLAAPMVAEAALHNIHWNYEMERATGHACASLDSSVRDPATHRPSRQQYKAGAFSSVIQKGHIADDQGSLSCIGGRSRSCAR